MPPCDAALIARRKNAIPHAHNAVAGVICSSSTISVFPTESKIDFVRSMASFDAFFDAMQVIDSCIAIAIVGMARTTCMSLPICLMISLLFTPDTTEIMMCLSGVRSGLISCSKLLSC